MSVNNLWGVDQKNLTKYGKYFASIDFEVERSPTKEHFERNRENVIAGEFKIGNGSYKVTLAELRQMIETLENAQRVFFQKYRMGR